MGPFDVKDEIDDDDIKDQKAEDQDKFQEKPKLQPKTNKI